MDWADVGAVVGLVGFVVTVVAAVYVGRNRGKDELIETQQKLIDGLRSEMEDNDRRCNAKIADLQEKVSHLQGKVDVLSEQQGAAIGAAIAPLVAAEVVKALNS